MNLFAPIDHVLDRVTMYRLVLYYLLAILIFAVGLSLAGVLPYTALSIVESTALLVVICLITNRIFASVFNAPINSESTYITALILACILPPLSTVHDLPLMGWAAVLSIASKYILAIRSKHVFNPVAIAVVLTGLWLNYPAIWWVGTTAMAPVIFLGGIVMVRKIRRFTMIMSFMVVSLVLTSLFSASNGYNVLNYVTQLVLHSSLLFLAFVMLTEPLTSPPTKRLQIMYGGLVGIFFVPQVHLGSLYFSPEMALVIGNIFSYIVSPKIKERLQLVRSASLSANSREFVFKPTHQLKFIPGQYMEFTLPHAKPDSRGSRRYITLASSPTDPEVKLGITFHSLGSSFKRSLLALQPGDTLMAGQLAGDFTFPKNPEQKVAFIAGGIGITPFISMLTYLLATGSRRDIVLVYVNKGPEDLAYIRQLDEAVTKLSLTIVYTFTTSVPEGWMGQTGRISQEMITSQVPDFSERVFYVSGPAAMVTVTKQVLQNTGLKKSQIITDFFPGLA